jgi:uncharacterized protein
MKLNKLRRRRGGVIDRRAEGPTGGGGGLGFPMPDGGSGGFPMPGGGGGLPIPGGRGGLGIGGILLIILLVFIVPRCLGNGGGLIPDPGAVEGFPDVGAAGGSSTQVDPTDPAGAFADAVADDVQITWEETFATAGQADEDTEIVLFTGSTSTGCGRGSAQTGPFYCPLDRRVYIDLSFFKVLEQQFGASGDFAQAYVIAHEFGHHVQTLVGISEQVNRASQQNPSIANELSVRQELQADCLAGVWASSANARGVLEPGDLEEGINAAEQIGDDRIQQKTQGRIDPESWTHGSAEQRQHWLRTGFDAGNMQSCDTFEQDFDEL